MSWEFITHFDSNSSGPRKIFSYLCFEAVSSKNIFLKRLTKNLFWSQHDAEPEWQKLQMDSARWVKSFGYIEMKHRVPRQVVGFCWGISFGPHQTQGIQSSVSSDSTTREYEADVAIYFWTLEECTHQSWSPEMDWVQQRSLLNYFSTVIFHLFINPKIDAWGQNNKT